MLMHSIVVRQLAIGLKEFVWFSVKLDFVSILMDFLPLAKLDAVMKLF